MIVIMLGAPATGKGTVATMLKERLGVVHISTGDMFRECIAEGTEIGKKLDEYISKGCLVPDELVIEMINARLEKDDVASGVILDGFPRTEKQAEELDKLLAKKGKEITMVINLQTPEEEIIERITNRRICKKCKAIYNVTLHPSKVEGICDICGGETYQRDDDTEAKARNRLAIYYKETAPLIEYYKKTGKLYSTVLSTSQNRMAPEVVNEVVPELEGK